MEQYLHEYLTEEEIHAFDETLGNVLDDATTSREITYTTKASQSVDYDTGTVTPGTPATATINALRFRITRKQMEDMNIASGTDIYLIRKQDLDDEGITPKTWDTITDDSVVKHVNAIFCPFPNKHYRIVVGDKGKD